MLVIRSQEPSFATASVISEAMLAGDLRLYVDDTTSDVLRRLGHIRRGETCSGAHPGIGCSIAESDAETRGAATPDNPRPARRNEQ